MLLPNANRAVEARDLSTKRALLIQKVYIYIHLPSCGNSTKIGHRCFGNDRMKISEVCFLAPVVGLFLEL